MLDEKGRLSETGYAYELVKAYNRPAINASKYRIKEWDYHYVRSGEHGFGITIADNGYMGLIGLAHMDFKNRTVNAKTKILLLTRGRFMLPCTTIDGDISLSEKGVYVNIGYESDKTHLKLHWPGFYQEGPITLEFTSVKPESSMVLATPFKKDNQFYYNQKIIGMKTTGIFQIGDKKLQADANALTLLDFGRGVWPYRTQWYWGAAQGYQNGKRIGLNIGHGFGEQHNASEDMLFVDGKAHKLTHGRFTIQKNDKGKPDYMEPWRYESEDGTMKLTFTPQLKRSDKTNLWIIKSDQNQVFGHYNGEIKLEKEIFKIESLPGFAEAFFNRW